MVENVGEHRERGRFERVGNDCAGNDARRRFERIVNDGAGNS